MYQQKGNGDGGDVMGTADLENVPQAHDGGISGCDVARAHIVIHTQVEHHMDLRQVGMSGNVEFTWGKNDYISMWKMPVAARIKFKSLMLAYRVLVGSAPAYLNALVRANVTPRTLRSSSERRLALPSVQALQSKLFSFVVPRWWNELPSTTRAGASLSTFKKLLKTQLFREHLPS